MPASKMICPRCGAVMNYHAEKLDRSEAWEEPSEAEVRFGGRLIEIHTCPACGMGASRPAQEG